MQFRKAKPSKWRHWRITFKLHGRRLKNEYFWNIALRRGWSVCALHHSIDTLLTELKRLDDKMILTEVHPPESRVYRGIGNFAKAKVWCPIHSRCIHFEASLHITSLPSHLWKRQRILSTVRLRFTGKPPWSPIWHSPRRRQGLHHCLLLLPPLKTFPPMVKMGR